MNEHDKVQKSSAGTVKPIALGELDPGAATAGAPLAAGAALLGALKNVKVKLTVCVGSVEIPLGDLVHAKSQQVLVLDQGAEEPVDVLLEGQVVARGVLVAVDDRFGIRLTELPAQLERVAGGAET
jgi:flagellar motor switch protein FliN/FliY